MLRKNVCSDIDIYIKEMELYFKNIGIQNIKLSIKNMPPLNIMNMGYDPTVTYIIKKEKKLKNQKSLNIIHLKKANIIGMIYANILIAYIRY